ncbi:hypothetical protein Plhal304r1_c037g0113191 [Plasmopara halstedii]
MVFDINASCETIRRMTVENSSEYIREFSSYTKSERMIFATENSSEYIREFSS